MSDGTMAADNDTGNVVNTGNAMLHNAQITEYVVSLLLPKTRLLWLYFEVIVDLDHKKVHHTWTQMSQIY